MKKEMDSMREFNVYTEIPIEQTSEEQTHSAIDLKGGTVGNLIRNCAGDWLHMVVFRKARNWILIVCLLALHHWLRCA